MKNLMLKIAFAASLLLASPAVLCGQASRYDGMTFTPSGRPAAGATVAVCTQPATTSVKPCTPLATLYTDTSGSVACNGSNGCSNPTTADGNGNYHFYYRSSAGPFTFQTYGSGLTAYVQPDQLTSWGGNGSSVIDVYKIAGGNLDLYVATNTAVAACTSGPCHYDYRGYNGLSNVILSQRVGWPDYSEIYLPQTTITRSMGAAFLVSGSQFGNVRVHGSTKVNGTIIAGQTTDLTPAITWTGYFSNPPSANTGLPHNVEIDHVTISTQVLGGFRSTLSNVTSVGNSVGALATYTGTFPNCGANACVGQWWIFRGFPKYADDEGVYYVQASTTTTLTVYNNAAAADTPPDGLAYYDGTYAIPAGNWAIMAPFTGANLHDITTNTDMGIMVYESGCSCYNYLWNLTLNSKQGGLYLGKGSNSGTLQHIVSDATDMGLVGFPLATGFGVWVRTSTGLSLVDIEAENSKYSIFLSGSWNHSSNLQWENDYLLGQGIGTQPAISLPTFGKGATYSTMDLWEQPVDFNSNPQTNTYGLSGTRNLFYGSLSGNVVAGPSSKSTSAQQVAGATTYHYWLVPIDFNGNKGLPISMPDVTSQYATIGPVATMPVTSITLSAGKGVYAGTFTNATTAGAKAGDVFTFTGFSNPLNNGTFSCTTVSGSSLTCANGSAINETISASAVWQVLNLVSPSGGSGIWGYDVLGGTSGDTAHSVTLNVPFQAMPYIDNNGSAGAGYTAPTRDATGDAAVGGRLSVGELTLFKHYTVAQLGALASPVTDGVAWVTDANASNTCTASGGSHHVLCVYNGSAWTNIFGY